MAKTYTLKHSKDKKAIEIIVSATTGADDFAGFAALGYDVAAVQKQIAADVEADSEA